MTVLILTYVFFAYSYFTRSTYVEPLVKPVATVIDSIPTESTQQTTIGYVERAPNDNAQVTLDTNVPQVVVRANDKEYTMPSTVKESSAFENGQLKIKQESTTKIDVTQVVNEQMEQERKALLAKYNRPNELKGAFLVGRSSFYFGTEYEAKMWDVGVYQRLAGDGDDRLIKGSATVLRW